ncbi:MAG: TolC family protein [Candidatus Melainabacteria bacterium]|nr:TolC family protein [Candidatus Melainabacteria bacterium]
MFNAVVFRFSVRQFRQRRLFCAAWFFCLLLWVLPGLFALHLPLRAEDAVPAGQMLEEKQPRPESAEAVTTTATTPAAPLEALTRQLQSLQWEEPWQPHGVVASNRRPTTTRLIDLKEVLETLLAESPEIRLQEAKVQEARVRQQGVKNRRVLFLFKTLNSPYLEGSAENNVEAAEAHLETVRYQTLLKGLDQYYGLLEASLAKYTAFRNLRLSLRRVEVSQSRFDAGEDTSFDVNATQRKLIKAYQDYLKADRLYRSASFALAQPMGLLLSADETLLPVELGKSAQPLLMPPMVLFQPLPTEAAVVQSALAHRPELKELANRRESLENLVKASAYDFNRNQIQLMEALLAQAKQGETAGRQGIAITAQQAYSDATTAGDMLALAKDQLDLAQQAVRQVEIGYEAGFNSALDVLEFEVMESQALAARAVAQLAQNKSQLHLAYEMGTLSLPRLLEALPPRCQAMERPNNANNASE